MILGWWLCYFRDFLMFLWVEYMVIYLYCILDVEFQLSFVFLQLAFSDAVYLVDAIEGGEELIIACKPALESNYITKVIHDCKRDSEVSDLFDCLLPCLPWSLFCICWNLWNVYSKEKKCLRALTCGLGIHHFVWPFKALINFLLYTRHYTFSLASSWTT